MCLQTSCAAQRPSMDLFIVALAIIAAFYVAVRLVLRLYFPSDT